MTRKIVLALAFAGLPLVAGLAIAWAVIHPRGQPPVAQAIAAPQAQDYAY